MAKSGYPQLKVNPVGHQSGRARYPQAPRISTWRNNLTALSQYYNLYFVALEDRVRVFSPSFPQQHVPGEACLSIKYEASAVRHRGHIDSRKPHAANHIIVQDLGHEEILLIACDDGDIIAYRTQAIQAAVVSRSVKAPKAFFVQNVGLSAWGLAIHRHSRLIAVSSNSFKILIFAFALSNPKTKGERLELPAEHQNYPFEQFGGSFTSVESPKKLRSQEESNYLDPVPNDRRQDIVFGLNKHTNNVPNIAFWIGARSEEDVFLASVDIDGRVIIWNVWRRQMLFTIQVPLASGRYRGWSLLCIDPSNFRRCNTERDAYGCDHTPPITIKRYSHVTARENTECIHDVDDNSLQHPALAKFSIIPHGGAMEIIHTPMTTNPLEDADDDYDEEDEDELGEESEDIEEPNTFDSDSDSDSEHETSAEAGLDTPPQAQETNHTASGIDQLLFPPHASTINDFLTQRRSMYESLSSSRLAPFGHAAQPEDWIPFDLLCTTETEVTLLSDIPHFRNLTVPTVIPNCKALVCQNALHQDPPPNLPTLRHIERLNMTLQIPELGLVLVGNQSGRVAVLALTTLVSSSSVEGSLTSPGSSGSQQSSAGSSSYSTPRRNPRSNHAFSSAPSEPPINTPPPRPEHGFKVEAILPLASQERADKRPDTPLLGMAVAPVQQRLMGGDSSGSGGGDSPPNMTTNSAQRRHTSRPVVTSDTRGARNAVGHGEVEAAGSGSRRWRLIMMYYDHTVLTYEIWRAGQEGSLLII